MLCYGNAIRELYEQSYIQEYEVEHMLPDIDINRLPYQIYLSSQEKIEIHDLLLALLLNSCMCLLKLNESQQLLQCAQIVRVEFFRRSIEYVVVMTVFVG